MTTRNTIMAVFLLVSAQGAGFTGVAMAASSTGTFIGSEKNVSCKGNTMTWLLSGSSFEHQLPHSDVRTNFASETECYRAAVNIMQLGMIDLEYEAIVEQTESTRAQKKQNCQVFGPWGRSYCRTYYKTIPTVITKESLTVYFDGIEFESENRIERDQ